jgi:fibronectin-binding autotransporter adhesin
VVNGGTISNDFGTIAHGTSSVASASFSQSVWNNTGSLIVGLDGDGSLSINDRSTVTSAVGIIGRGSAAIGSVLVDNASWQNAGNLFVAHGVTGLPSSHADGKLGVRNGAQVTSSAGMIAFGAGSTGAVTVTGSNAACASSSWVMSSNLYVGYSGFGTLRVEDGGFVSNRATHIGYNGALVPGATGELELAGSAGRRGVLETQQVLGGTGAGGGAARIDFNGGVLRASLDEPWFLRNISGVSVQAGGAFVDSNQHDIGIDATINGPGGLGKLGLGTLDLRGIASLGGLSTVDGGTLLVNGNFSGNMQVNAGGTLGGSGQLNGSVDVLPGGILSPGNSPGSFTVGALTLHPGSRLVIEVGAVSDHLMVNGDLVLGGFIDFIGDAAFFAAGLFPSFISYTGNFVNAGVSIGLLPNGVDRSLFALDFSTPGAVSIGTGVQAVPEPETYALLLAGLGVVAAMTKRRRTMRPAPTSPARCSVPPVWKAWCRSAAPCVTTRPPARCA